MPAPSRWCRTSAHIDVSVSSLPFRVQRYKIYFKYHLIILEIILLNLHLPTVSPTPTDYSAHTYRLQPLHLPTINNSRLFVRAFCLKVERALLEKRRIFAKRPNIHLNCSNALCLLAIRIGGCLLNTHQTPNIHPPKHPPEIYRISTWNHLSLFPH